MVSSVAHLRQGHPQRPAEILSRCWRKVGDEFTASPLQHDGKTKPFSKGRGMLYSSAGGQTPREAHLRGRRTVFSNPSQNYLSGLTASRILVSFAQPAMRIPTSRDGVLLSVTKRKAKIRA